MKQNQSLFIVSFLIETIDVPSEYGPHSGLIQQISKKKLNMEINMDLLFQNQCIQMMCILKRQKNASKCTLKVQLILLSHFLPSLSNKIWCLFHSEIFCSFQVNLNEEQLINCL